MTRIRTLVVDDEPVARQRVLTLLRDEPDIEVIGECADGAEACTAIDRLSPDLVLLDVQIPAMDGFAVCQAIPPERMPAVVFITAYDEYALQAFEVHAIDYLLKPFSGPRFKAALSHVREQLERHRAGDLSRKLLSLMPTVRAHGATRLVVKAGGRVYFVRATDIDYCEAAGNYVRLHVGAHEHLLRETLSHLESRLDAQQFVRIHRSTIVNFDRIQELQSSFGGECIVVLRGGTRLTLSRGYRESLQARLGQTF
jgi:two-component system, LytTR family, response regulator